MTKRLILPSLLALMACSKTQTTMPTKQDASIHILDSAALEFLDADAKLEIISTGHSWSEGPLWLEKQQSLLFTDIPNNAIYQVKDGQSSIYLQPSGYTGSAQRGGEVGANGLTLDPQGRLVMCQHGDRRLATMDAPLDNPSSKFVTLADNFQGKKLNSPNDVVFDKLGNMYFTDPPYGLEFNMNDPAKELDFQGIYCLKTDGELVLVDSISRPNGITFSPDQKKLLVANSDPELAVWYEYDLIAPGKVENRRIFFDASEFVGKDGYKGLPDGMKMNSSRILFATGPGGVWVFDQNGKALARIQTGEATSNCALSTDEKTLFMTADSYVLKMALR
jgi:gluconolactonase